MPTHSTQPAAIQHSQRQVVMVHDYHTGHHTTYPIRHRHTKPVTATAANHISHRHPMAAAAYTVNHQSIATLESIIQLLQYTIG